MRVRGMIRPLRQIGRALYAVKPRTPEPAAARVRGPVAQALPPPGGRDACGGSGEDGGRRPLGDVRGAPGPSLVTPAAAHGVRTGAWPCRPGAASSRRPRCLWGVWRGQREEAAGRRAWRPQTVPRYPCRRSWRSHGCVALSLRRYLLPEAEMLVGDLARTEGGGRWATCVARPDRPLLPLAAAHGVQELAVALRLAHLAEQQLHRLDRRQRRQHPA